MPDETYTQGRLTVWGPTNPYRHGFPLGVGPQLCVVSAFTGVIEEADARRLAAAWNAVEGLDTATVERLDVKALLEALTNIERAASWLSRADAATRTDPERYQARRDESWADLNDPIVTARALLARVEGRAE